LSGREPASTRDGYSLFRTVPTRWNDNDLYGHMNNAIHYLVFDTAVNGWLLEVGLLDFGAETAFIVAETGCRYHGDIMFPDVVHVGMRIARLGGSSVIWQIGLFRGDAEVAAADGRFVHVHVRRDGHKPTPMSAAQRAVLQPWVMG
jgi:acyl-CoA thioester hydrolase